MVAAKAGLTLRGPIAGDDTAIGDWLPGALIVAMGDVDRASTMTTDAVARIRGEDATARIIDVDGEPAGVIVAEPDGDTLRIPLIAVHREDRQRGIGSRAIAALEREQRRKHRFLGALAPGDGRSLYFWLRLGYKPVAIEGDSGRRVWMERRESSPRRRTA